MKDGICPKCKSADVHAGTHFIFKGGTGAINTIPVSFWTRAAIDNYVCVRCGYVERYIADSNKLKDIQEKWPKVTQTKQQ